eukprot:6992110-Pyramimonas_sp.AAC.1
MEQDETEWMDLCTHYAHARFSQYGSDGVDQPGTRGTADGGPEGAGLGAASEAAASAPEAGGGGGAASAEGISVIPPQPSQAAAAQPFGE